MMRMFRVVFETDVMLLANNENEAKTNAQLQLMSHEDAYRSTRKVSHVEEWYRQ